MGNVERCGLTLPLNTMVFHVRRDAELRRRWTTDLEALARESGPSAADYEVGNGHGRRERTGLIGVPTRPRGAP
jgi:hypothetical protein